MLNINNFLDAVTEDYYAICAGNVPTRAIPEQGNENELWEMIGKLKALINGEKEESAIEMQILDIYTYGEKKGFNAGFKMALSLAGLDIPEDEKKNLTA